MTRYAGSMAAEPAPDGGAAPAAFRHPRPRGLGLIQKGALVMAGLGAVLVISIGAALYPAQKNAMVRSTLRDLDSIASQHAHTIDAWIRHQEHMIRTLSQSPPLRRALTDPGSGDVAAVRAILQTWAGPTRPTRSLQVVDAETGTVLVASNPLDEGKDRSNRPYFVEARESAMVTPPFHAVEHRRPVMIAAAPVKDSNGRTVVILAGLLHLQQLTDHVVPPSQEVGTLDVYMVNEAGFAITPPRHLENRGVLKFGVRTEAVRRCLNGDSGVIEQTGYQGRTVLSAYRWIPGRNSCVLAEIEASQLLGEFRSALGTLVGALGLGLLAATLLGAWLARGLLQPIVALRAAAEDVEHGKSTSLPVDRKDEIGDLAATFNRMSRTIALNREELESRSARLADYAREMERLAYAASHDLRAPLRAVDSLAQWLQDDLDIRPGSEAAENFQLLHGRIRRMDILLDDILRYQRADRLLRESEMVDAARLAQQVARDALPPAVTFENAVALPAFVTPRAALAEIFHRLMENAAKHHDREAGIVTLDAVEHEDAFEFRLSDDGPGIAPEFHDRVFIMFQTLRPRDVVEASGVGLTMVKKILDLVGGEISLESAPPVRGTTVRFTWPKRIAPPDAGDNAGIDL